MRIAGALLTLALAAGGASAGAAPREPTPLRGIALQESGLRLLAADEPPFMLDVDSGRVQRVPVRAVAGVGEGVVPDGDGRSVWIKRRDGRRCTLRQAA